MERAADVENTAFAHVTLACLCVQGVEDTAWLVQIRTGAGFCTREGRCPACTNADVVIKILVGSVFYTCRTQAVQII